MPPAAETFRQWKLVLLAPWSDAVIAAGVAVAAAALLLSLWALRRQPRRGIAVALGLLRLLGVALVLAIFLEPAVQVASVTRVPNHVVILVDGSASMAVREHAGAPSRFARAAALLRASRARLAAWSRGRHVDAYLFADKLTPLPDPFALPPAPAGRATRVRAALAAIARRHAEGDLAGVVLISDGIDNGRFGAGPLSTPARELVRRLGAPVHTVWVGSPDIRDVAVAEVRADDFAFVRNAVTVEADITASGVSPRELAVTLRRGARVLAKKRVTVGGDARAATVRFGFVPERVGKRVYSVAVDRVPGEAVTSNNRRAFVVDVIRDRIRVLQLAGRPSWDERFLRELLKRDPNVDLISFFILRTPASVDYTPTRELSLIPFPTEELFVGQLGSFDLVILQNFNHGPYGVSTYLPLLRRYVERGGGLAMVGGDLAFSSGGYPGTAVADLLPVRLLPATLPPDELVDTTDFTPRLTPAGAAHPLLQLAAEPGGTPRLLAALPPLQGVNRVAGAAPGARVLAVHPTLRDRDGAPLPVLAVREVGKGRTLALTTDTSWHWAFPAAGQGLGRRAYDTFWRSAIRWLIRDPELSYLRVVARANRVRLGEPLRAVARAYGSDYRPARGVALRYEVWGPDGARVGGGRGETDAQGELDVAVTPVREGAHRVRVTGTVAGRPARAEAVVLVVPSGPERREVRATPALLKSLAGVSGGRYLGAPAALPDLPFRPQRVLRVNWQRDVEVWSRWWTLALVVVIFGLEWLLRRRFGHL